MSNEPKSPIFLNVLSIFISLLIGLLIVEALTRILIPSVTWKAYKSLDLGWASDEYLAFRPEQDPVIEGQKRILYLGDSYLAGSGVINRDDRFPLVLQERLGEGFISRILATGGWGTDQELLAFMQKGGAWKPDLVIVAFTAHNDIRNNASIKGGRAYKPYFVVRPENRELELFDHRGQPMSWPKKAPQSGIPIRSHVWDLLSSRFVRKENDTPIEPDSSAFVDPRYRLVLNKKEFQKDVTGLKPRLTGSPQQHLNNISAYIQGDFEPINFAWDLLEGILMQLKREVEATGAELLVVLLPDTIKAQDTRFITGSDFSFEFDTPRGPFILDMSEPRRRMVNITKRLGIELFDPTASFIRYIEAEDLVEATWPRPPDNHFSAVGHQIIADQLYEYLDRHGHFEN